MSQTPRVFISYSRSDGELFAEDLFERLTNAGIPVWRDREEMRGGEGWWDQIERVLDRAEFLVVVMTPGAVESQTVQKEWDLARRKGVCIFPVIASSEMSWDELPIWMRKGHCYDLKHEEQKFINDLNTRCERIRVPFMVEDLPSNYVLRSRLFDQLLKILVDEKRGSPKPAIAALRGAGGFGKTMMARALCHDIRARYVFYDGILWVSLGTNPENLAGKVDNLIFELTGGRTGFTEVADASNRLRELLQEKNVLIVIDDVWHEADARPFLVGGPECAWLLTTRNRDVLQRDIEEVVVGEMEADESIRLLGAGLPWESVRQPLKMLAERLCEWPLLLNLVHRILVDRVQRRGQTTVNALTYVNTKLDQQGLVAFDRGDRDARELAVKKTIGVSLELLQPDEESSEEIKSLFRFHPLNRFEELAVFPEEATIPLSVVSRLWHETAEMDDFSAEELCNRLFDLSLLLNYDLPTQTIHLHDVVHAYLRHQIGKERESELHRQLADVYLNKDSRQEYDTSETGYYLNHLTYHLAAGGRLKEMYDLIDQPWMETKSRALHSHQSFNADVQLAIQSAHREDPPNLLQLSRLSLISSTLISLATSTPVEVISVLAHCGKLDQARGSASLIVDPERRFDAFFHLALGLKEKDTPATKKEFLGLLEEVFGMAIQDRETRVEQLLDEILSIMEPEEILQNISSADTRRRVLSFLLAKLDSRDRLEFARRVRNSPEFQTVEMITTFSELGELERALQIAEGRNDKDEGFNYERSIARSAAESGDLERALAIADAHQSAWDYWSSDFTFVEYVANSLVQIEDPNKLETVVQRIQTDDLKTRICQQLVRSLSAANQFQRAREAASFIQSGDRNYAFYDIAGDLCKKHRFAEALALQNDLTPEWHTVLKALVAKYQAETEKGALELAQEAAKEVDTIEDDLRRAVALTYLSLAFQSLGCVKESNDLALKSMAVAKSLSENKRWVLLNSGATLIKNGCANELGPLTLLGWERREVATQWASHLIEMSEFDKAIKLMDELEDAFDKSRFLCTILPDLFEAHDSDRIVVAIRNIEGNYYRSNVLAKLTDLSIEKREYAQVVEALETIDAYYRTEHVEKLIPHLVESDEAELASAAIEGTEDQGLRIKYLRTLMRKAVESGKLDHTWHPYGEGMSAELVSELQLEISETFIRRRELDQAVEAAKANEGFYRNDALEKVFIALMDDGQVNRVLELVSQMNSEYKRDDVLKRLAAWFVGQGDWQSAHELLKQMSESTYLNHKLDVLEMIFEYLLTAKDYNTARQIASQMPAQAKHEYLAKLALALTRSGDDEGAMRLANEILFSPEGNMDLRGREKFFLKIAEKLVELGLYETDRILESNLGLDGVGELLAKKAEHLARLNQFSEAFQTITLIDEEIFQNLWYRAKALLEIASQLRLSNRNDEARECALRAKTETANALHKQEFMLRLWNERGVNQLAKSYEVAVGCGAFPTADAIRKDIQATDLGIELDIIASLAPLLVESGKTTIAYGLTEAIEDEVRRAKAWDNIAAIQLRNGQKKECLESALKAIEAIGKAKSWSHLEAQEASIRLLILAGDRQRWREPLATAEAEFEQDPLLKGAAVTLASAAALALAEVGVQNEAAKLIERFLEVSEKSARSEFASALFHLGRIDEARELARELSGLSEGMAQSDWENKFRYTVAQLLAKTGDTPGALAVLNAAYDPSKGLGMVMDETAEKMSLAHGPKDGARFWSEAVNKLDSAEDRATMLCHIAHELNNRAQPVEAMHVLAEALWLSRNLYRGTLFSVLEKGVNVIASVQRGELLEKMYAAFVRTDGWWLGHPSLE